MICCVPLLSMGLLQYMSLYIYIRHGRRSPTIFLSFFVDSATKPATDATSLKEQQQQQQQHQREAWQTTTARAATTVSDRSLLVSLCLCTESKGQARKRGCCEFHKQVEKGLHLSINQSIDQSIYRLPKCDKTTTTGTTTTATLYQIKIKIKIHHKRYNVHL